MKFRTNHSPYVKPPDFKRKNPAVRWFKEWVPQELVSTGKTCYLLKWVTEDMLISLKEKYEKPEPEEPKPEPTTEVLYLCSYEGCGRGFTDAGSFRKHSQIHGERQYACFAEGCGKKFFDSSKLKRHLVVHTGAKDFLCPHEGCGKAFNLHFNLKAHMKTHSPENYHVCPHPECGRRYTDECKLKTHIKSDHEKSTSMSMRKHKPAADKLHKTSKPPQVVYGSPSADRPYACPYKGCGKAYIHGYKLKLHLRKEHPGHNPEENSRYAPAIDHSMDEASDQDACIAKDSFGKNLKRSKPIQKMPPANLSHRKGPNLNIRAVRNQWPSKEMYEKDSEETEEAACENAEEDGWRYQ